MKLLFANNRDIIIIEKFKFSENYFSNNIYLIEDDYDHHTLIDEIKDNFDEIL